MRRIRPELREEWRERREDVGAGGSWRGWGQERGTYSTRTVRWELKIEVAARWWQSLHRYRGRVSYGAVTLADAPVESSCRLCKAPLPRLVSSNLRKHEIYTCGELSRHRAVCRQRACMMYV